MSKSTKKNAAYTIDFVHNTVTITKKFAEAANDIMSNEFSIMKELRAMGLTIIEKAPVKRKNDLLTYKKMAKHIASLTTAEADMKEFEAVRKASLGQKNPYRFVFNWFMKKYENYGELPVMTCGETETASAETSEEEVA